MNTNDATYTKQIVRESKLCIDAKVFRNGVEFASNFWMPFFGITESTYKKAHKWADEAIRLDKQFSKP